MYKLMFWDEGCVNIKYVHWSNVWFKVDISLLILCLDDVSRAVNRVLRSPTMIVFWSVSPFSSLSSWSIYFGALNHVFAT